MKFYLRNRCSRSKKRGIFFSVLNSMLFIPFINVLQILRRSLWPVPRYAKNSRKYSCLDRHCRYIFHRNICHSSWASRSIRHEWCGCLHRNQYCLHSLPISRIFLCWPVKLLINNDRVWNGSTVFRWSAWIDVLEYDARYSSQIEWKANIHENCIRNDERNEESDIHRLQQRSPRIIENASLSQKHFENPRPGKKTKNCFWCLAFASSSLSTSSVSLGNFVKNETICYCIFGMHIRQGIASLINPATLLFIQFVMRII